MPMIKNDLLVCLYNKINFIFNSFYFIIQLSITVIIESGDL